MPFKKRDGQYYFEAVEALNTLSQELLPLHLALCPVCAAKYKEFVKRDEAALQLARAALVASDAPLVGINYFCNWRAGGPKEPLGVLARHSGAAVVQPVDLLGHRGLHCQPTPSNGWV